MWSGSAKRRLQRGALLFSITLSACGLHVEWSGFNVPPVHMKPRPPEEVEVYVGTAPGGAYVDVGLLEVEQESSFSSANTQDMVARLREVAGQLGCDALVLGGIGSKNSELESVLFDHNANRKTLQASCVVYERGESQSGPGRSATRAVERDRKP